MLCQQLHNAVHTTTHGYTTCGLTQPACFLCPSGDFSRAAQGIWARGLPLRAQVPAPASFKSFTMPVANRWREASALSNNVPFTDAQLGCIARVGPRRLVGLVNLYRVLMTLAPPALLDYIPRPLRQIETARAHPVENIDIEGELDALYPDNDPDISTAQQRQQMMNHRRDEERVQENVLGGLLPASLMTMVGDMHLRVNNTASQRPIRVDALKRIYRVVFFALAQVGEYVPSKLRVIPDHDSEQFDLLVAYWSTELRMRPVLVANALLVLYPLRCFWRDVNAQSGRQGPQGHNATAFTGDNVREATNVDWATKGKHSLLPYIRAALGNMEGEGVVIPKPFASPCIELELDPTQRVEVWGSPVPEATDYNQVSVPLQRQGARDVRVVPHLPPTLKPWRRCVVKSSSGKARSLDGNPRPSYYSLLVGHRRSQESQKMVPVWFYLHRFIAWAMHGLFRFPNVAMPNERLVRRVEGAWASKLVVQHICEHGLCANCLHIYHGNAKLNCRSGRETEYKKAARNAVAMYVSHYRSPDLYMLQNRSFCSACLRLADIVAYSWGVHNDVDDDDGDFGDDGEISGSSDDD